MPKNDGTIPPYPLVDVRYRNGKISRRIDPTKRRWKEWEHSPWDWDIASWQPAREE